MSLKFDEASIDRGVRSRRGNFCPPMATHQPPFVSAYVPTVARYLSAFDQHSSRCVYARAAARYAIRISRALSVVNRKRAFTQSRLKASGGSGACPYLVHRSIKFRPALVPPPLSPLPVLITCISSVRNGSRFRSKYSADTWPCVSLRASRRSTSPSPLFASRIRIIVLTTFLFSWTSGIWTGWVEEMRANCPSFQVRLNLFAATWTTPFVRIVYYWIVYGGLVWI